MPRYAWRTMENRANFWPPTPNVSTPQVRKEKLGELHLKVQALLELMMAQQTATLASLKLG